MIFQLVEAVNDWLLEAASNLASGELSLAPTSKGATLQAPSAPSKAAAAVEKKRGAVMLGTEDDEESTNHGELIAKVRA